MSDEPPSVLDLVDPVDFSAVVLFVAALLVVLFFAAVFFAGADFLVAVFLVAAFFAPELSAVDVPEAAAPAAVLLGAETVGFGSAAREVSPDTLGRFAPTGFSSPPSCSGTSGTHGSAGGS